ncbi:MAG: 3-oxoacyl-ACP reductase FabG [Thermoplasmata archaeon]|nr:3-oxoacyl-ACP reductase FabG [Thermoplasmata archaeon]
MPDGKLKDKVALVTGGASGIGEATVAKFAEEGAKLVINDVDVESANKLAKELESKGTDVLVVKADVSKGQEVGSMVDKIIERFGRLDILINNAGINRDTTLKKMSEDQWDVVIDVNLKGTFLCAQAAAKAMMENNYGKIINTSSIGALGNIGQSNYGASKAGVIGLTKSLALELARYNINVNCVAPGATKTPMLAKLPSEIAEKFMKMIPFKRFAESTEVANLHLFLASDESSYITGQVIFIDGGLSVGF